MSSHTTSLLSTPASCSGVRLLPLIREVALGAGSIDVQRSIDPAALEPIHLQLAHDALTRLRGGEDEVHVLMPEHTGVNVRLGIPLHVIAPEDRERLTAAEFQDRSFSFLDRRKVILYGLFLPMPDPIARMAPAREQNAAAALIRTSLHFGKHRDAAEPVSPAKTLERLLNARPAIATVSDFATMTRVLASWHQMVAVTEFSACLAAVMLKRDAGLQ